MSIRNQIARKTMARKNNSQKNSPSVYDKLQDQDQKLVNLLIDTLTGNAPKLDNGAKNIFRLLSMRARNASSNNVFTGRNIPRIALSIAENGFTSPYFMTFKQAEEKGFKIRKGEKGTLVYKFSTYTKKDEEGNEEIKECYKPYYIFNLDQMEGDKTAYAHDEFEPLNEEERNVIIDNLLENLGEKVQHTMLTDEGQSGYYKPHADVVYMFPKEAYTNYTSYYRTLLHEIGHLTGHKSRLNRGFKNEAYEELIAECTSALLCNEWGVAHQEALQEKHANYLKMYAGVLKKDPKKALQALDDAMQAVEYIKTHYITI